MKGNDVGELLKKIITSLRSMARAKTLALKSKTRALKARFIIFSLLSNKKFLMSSLSHKLHNALNSGHHHIRSHKLKSHDDGDDRGTDHDDEAIGNFIEEEGQEDEVQHDDSMIMSHHRKVIIPYSTHAVPAIDNSNAGEDDGDEKYPDLTHSMFEDDTEEDQVAEYENPAVSVIDLVKSSKQEAGETFSLEEEIDHVADLFIKRFHRQMRLQKQNSFKEFQAMLQRGL